MRFVLFICLFPILSFAQYDGNTTLTYPELITQYQKWDKEHAEITLYNMGMSDTEFPLYVCLINAGSDSLKAFEKAKSSTTVLINNAIHPGEPDGVNACLIWIQNWIKGGKKTKDLPVIAIIPAYNVGGMFNRSGTSRANQDGPVEYGFRGNAQNLDLNRDFIKMDSENAKTFARIYHSLNPDVFVDNHVSNGADYQYTLTLISSLKARLAPSISQITYDSFLPHLTTTLKKKKWDWCPYVDTKGETPDSGLVAFNDLPRYAMGYASLFNTISFTVETHMLKPFPERVQANLAFLEALIEWTNKNAPEIENARKQAVLDSWTRSSWDYNFSPTNDFSWIDFKGYTATHKTSEVTGLERLYYDRNQPYSKKIKFYDTYASAYFVRSPKAYIISAEAREIIDYLKRNGVEMSPVNSDSMSVSSLRIQSYESGKKPYEGHYLHSKVRCSEVEEKMAFPKGSMIVEANQVNKKFIVSVLEPTMEDSYFAWNFMDSYLQEKEYFSDYVFEDKALEILQANPELKGEFEAKKKNEPDFASDSWAQLFYIYSHSEYFEMKTFNRLPVFKLY